MDGNDFSENIKILSRLATSKSISWEEDAKSLPKDDPIAKLGLLADRLGIPLALAIDTDTSEDQFREILEDQSDA